MEWLADPQAWIALATLTALEIVLGIDNIIFLSIVVGRLPQEQRQLGRILGLAGAMITRIILLLSLAWIMRLTEPLFSIFSEEISGRDIILLLGGLFLLFKSTHEIHTSLEGEEESSETSIKGSSFFAIIIHQLKILVSHPRSASAIVRRRPTGRRYQSSKRDLRDHGMSSRAPRSPRL